MKFLSLVGLAPAAEVALLTALLATERETTTKLAIAISEQRTALGELALQLNASRDEVDAGERLRSRMQAEFDRTSSIEYQDMVQRYDKLVRKKDNSIDELTQRCDEANAFIAQLQSERPQMRLVRNEKPLDDESGDEQSAPAEDEVIVPEHTVEMSGRVIVISLEGKTHWTLSADDHLFKVPVHDRTFLDDPSHTFAKGSVVRAEFSETLLRRADGEPYTKRSLERVLEVIPPPPSITQPMFDAEATR